MRNAILLGVLCLFAASVVCAPGGPHAFSLLQKKGEPQEVVTYHRGTKNIHQRYQTVNGKPNGKFEQFRADGKTLEIEGTMKDGKRDGEWKYYHPNGKLQSEGTCKEDKKHGWWKAYDTNGNVTLEAEYEEDEQSGMQRVWKNGELWSEGKLVKGVKEGHWIEHKGIGSENGRAEGPYVKGKKHGEWKMFRGREYFKGQFVDDAKDGKWTYHGIDDSEIGFETWAKGVQHGPTRMNFPRTDQLQYEGEYVLGRREGLWVTFHATGKKASEHTYKGNAEHGPQKTWYPDGAPHDEYSSANNQRVGEYKAWWNEGKMREHSQYDDKGVLASRKQWSREGVQIDEYDGKTRTWKRWDEKGNITYEQAGDEATEYYPGEGAKPKSKLVIKGSKIERTDFYESGAVMGKGPLDETRKREGQWVEYYENGNKSAEGKYKNNAKVGKWVEYHDNGKKAAEGEYISERETYDNEGKVIPAKPIRIGKWTFYDTEGKRTGTETFPDPRKG